MLRKIAHIDEDCRCAPMDVHVLCKTGTICQTTMFQS